MRVVEAKERWSNTGESKVMCLSDSPPLYGTLGIVANVGRKIYNPIKSWNPMVFYVFLLNQRLLCNFRETYMVFCNALVEYALINVLPL